jgi:predicted Zn-dependent peptidase
MQLTTNVSLCKIKDGKQLNFILLFPIKNSPENAFYIKYLTYILSTTSKKFPLKEDFETEKLRKVVFNNYIELEQKNNISFIVANFSTLEENAIKDFNLEEAFTFAMSAIFEPNIVNEEFEHTKFNYERDYFIDYNNGLFEDPYFRLDDDFFKTIDPKEELFKSYATRTKILESINPKNLYEFYLKNIKNNIFFPYVFGNIEEEKVNALFSRYTKAKVTVKYQNNALKVFKGEENINITKEIPFNQSFVFLKYKIKNPKKSLVTYYRLIPFLLDSRGSNLLFNKLRHELSLVYEVRLINYIKNGFFVIVGGIDQKNHDLFVKSVKEILDSLKQIENLKKAVAAIKEDLEISLLHKKDDNYCYQYDKKFSHDLGNFSIITFARKIKNIDFQTLLAVINDIELDANIFYRGE